jgi:hypothetical protein
LKKPDEINQKIKTIFREDNLLEDFSFFFNKAENIRVENSKIKQALEKFISSESKREMIEYEDKIAFIDNFKIEVIYDAVVNKSALKLPITLQEFKRKYQKNLLKTDEWGEKYRTFTLLYQEEDEILEFVSPRSTWKQLCGSSFIVLQRKDKALAVIAKSMN